MEKLLKDMGLTEHEIRVYTMLLDNGPSLAGMKNSVDFVEAQLAHITPTIIDVRQQLAQKISEARKIERNDTFNQKRIEKLYNTIADFRRSLLDKAPTSSMRIEQAVSRYNSHNPITQGTHTILHWVGSNSAIVRKRLMDIQKEALYYKTEIRYWINLLENDKSS